ncbi:MAG TPA: OsmC family protein [Terriglobales bacterium]|jgi:uncharacterized OsmC-like protein|nr:OsmC family protein [Terriglobales bacterium]
MLPGRPLLSAIAGCFTTTFRALADYSALNYTDLEGEVDGVVRKVRSGYEFSEIILRPKLTISNASELAAAARFTNQQ